MPSYQVYRNLNKRDAVWFSIRQSGRVREYRQTVYCRDAKLKHCGQNALVRIRQGCREVCAWVTCQSVDDTPPVDTVWRQLSCDPKRYDTFQDAETGATVDCAAWVRLSADGAFYSV